ncbi:MAG TPA: YebC/PmpR family DNA-binding transcriptional regulator [Gammaproteobacteria bacterium]|uniref:YebC/PmpR family DNA-binding transcriptional regulator n=1 Tax=Immundisolibacter sp. TaxID=1934948 RepID=UPI000E89F8BD|nr:YebC/PmpR family DNA-binding transcriptional regulator [Gammaproteobacteria bacterium]HCZ48686.1 YebC/PmpR family DNA-binding transcriptional regulator [Gammaproteobacteria bacterium]MCH78124.1 YebC/PmpR family DNA-binding transcriptional regulator [Gammaproteobacteria bacterium]
MAGHSKWANIQHRKSAQDAKRGKLFTKLIRELTVAARAGGTDPASNPRLRTAIDKALGANMTRDTVERAINRGGGAADADNYEAVRYEGYGPGGVAVMVDCLTDNRNRTVGEVRHLFSKAGGNLGTDGSVAYLFEARGVITLPGDVSEDRAYELALEAGADDVAMQDGNATLLTVPERLHEVREALLGLDVVVESAELVEQPSTSVELDAEQTLQVIRLLERLEDLDDVQRVHSNAEFSDEALAALA